MNVQEHLEAFRFSQSHQLSLVTSHLNVMVWWSWATYPSVVPSLPPSSRAPLTPSASSTNITSPPTPPSRPSNRSSGGSIRASHIHHRVWTQWGGSHLELSSGDLHRLQMLETVKWNQAEHWGCGPVWIQIRNQSRRTCFLWGTFWLLRSGSHLFVVQ